MRVSVNNPACTGHARCAAVAPTVYDLDDDGYCAVSELTVPDDQQDAAQLGADACPERAINIIS